MTNRFGGAICASTSADTLRDGLQRMLSVDVSNRDVPARSEMLEGAWMVDSSAPKPPAIARVGDLLVAFAGAPYWSDNSSTALAGEHGMHSAIAAAYRDCGRAFLNDLHGAFSVVVVDPSRQSMLAAIDRSGTCQLYFHPLDGEGVVFANNTRQIVAFMDRAASIDPAAIFEYLYFHAIPSPRSVFRGVHKLGPGECVEWQGSSLQSERYWKPQFDESPKSRRALEEELHALLRQSINRTGSEEAIGCFLSGGIDSSTIVGLVAELKGQSRSFTIGFNEPGYDETSFAKVSSGHFGSEAHTYFVTPQDVVDALPLIAETYDEPFGNSSVVPTYYCAKLAKEAGVETLLAGDGGDELFAGNARYATQKIFSVYDAIPAWIRSGLLEPVAFKTPLADKILPLRKLQSYIRQAKVPMPDRMETYNYFHTTPIDEVLSTDFMEKIDVESPLAALRLVYSAASAPSMLNRILELDWKFTLADNDLRKVTTMCDLAGVNVRFPFLDDDLIEFSTRVPPGMKLSGLRLRDFFKRSMRNFLPQEVLNKSKHGFGLPFGIWLKDYRPLRELAYDNMISLSERNIVRRRYVDGLIDAHQSVHAHYYGEMIWVLAMLEIWLTSHDVNV